ncbi:hypothetical protein Q3G72_015491 [Acer saccharum]|nr:hypothetical protein Q3G72_015491 [Acer saccharum]
MVEWQLESLPSMVSGVWSNENNLQLEATTQFRKMLSIERSPPIEEVIQSGVVPRFVEFLMREDFPQLQFEAAWALTNIASGTSENTKVVIDHGAVPIFVKLLASSSDDVREQAVWALGNVAGVCRRLAELLMHPAPSVLIPALRTVGNIVTGDDIQTQCIINHGALPCLLSLLTHNHKKSIKKEACWTISNITAGNNEQIQTIIDAGLIGPLVNLLQNAEFDIKKEAAWAISNATSGGTHEQVKYLVDQGSRFPVWRERVSGSIWWIQLQLKGSAVHWKEKFMLGSTRYMSGQVRSGSGSGSGSGAPLRVWSKVGPVSIVAEEVPM